MNTSLKVFITLLLCCFYIAADGQDYYYQNSFYVTRSSQTDFSNFVLLAPCPQSNEYQDINRLDYSSKGKWKLHEIKENQNKYLELYLDQSMLGYVERNFKVGYTFIHSPKKISIDFSCFKKPDGSWGEIPEYDTSAADYKNNINKCGSYVVPKNKTIAKLSDELFSQCDNNKLAYAEKCYEYVASHFTYMKKLTGLHTLSKIISDGGGDCANFSSVYISLLRAKGIPARHVVAIGANEEFHVWSEFYIQDFGWIPVDVTYKNSNPRGNYFGQYNGKWVVVQKGVEMYYPIAVGGTQHITLLQTFSYWFWYNAYAELNVSQKVSSRELK